MTDYLLDTHAFLWWTINDPQLPQPASAIILNPGNQIFVSLVTAWEIAIKISIGKLTDPGYLPKIIADEHFDALPMAIAHIEGYKTLPLHHRDPFDRMLIAQALAEGVTLISNETVFDRYGVARVWE